MKGKRQRLKFISANKSKEIIAMHSPIDSAMHLKWFLGHNLMITKPCYIILIELSLNVLKTWKNSIFTVIDKRCDTYKLRDNKQVLWKDNWVTLLIFSDFLLILFLFLSCLIDILVNIRYNFCWFLLDISYENADLRFSKFSYGFLLYFNLFEIF